jgi:pimeloyl-ACP methyl ester carboxylesterase
MAEPYYEDVGTGEPVVLLHAAVADSRQWDTQVPALAQRYRVIRYDMQGFGQTPAASSPPTRADELLALMDGLSIPRAHLVGVSNGGSAALDFAVENPDRVGALVLVAPGLSGLRLADIGGDEAIFEFDAAQEQREEAAVAAGDFAAATEVSLQTWLAGYGRQLTDLSPTVVEPVRKITEHTLRRGVGRAPTPSSSPGAARRLDSVRAPTLFIIGEYDLPNVRAMTNFAAGGIAGARVVELANAAHWLNVEHPAEFNQLVLDFLASATA